MLTFAPEPVPRPVPRAMMGLLTLFVLLAIISSLIVPPL